jgi:ArsR family transcriptional regulator, arsenate/arsenite/antimonite-responsive transcriptional repressor
MRDLELALKAAGDPTRTRILKLLEGRRLCVCQVQAVLRLAPSTVSKHLTILKLAGLVEDRRDGKWTEYAWSEQPAPHARGVLDLLRGALDDEPVIQADRQRLRQVLAISVEKLCSLPPARRSALGGVRATRRRRGGRARV